jgi:hypothetical protein
VTPKIITCTAWATILNTIAEKHLKIKMYVQITNIKFKKLALKLLKSNQYYQFLELITKRFLTNMDTNKWLNQKPKMKEKMHYNLCTQTHTLPEHSTTLNLVRSLVKIQSALCLWTCGVPWVKSNRQSWD